MSDVFISYASEDRTWVNSFAQALKQQGWSVWWDRQIPIGQTYDNVIWSALQSAKCVVVVWSTHSIGSEWVKEEASEAKKKNILLPIRIDESSPPFGFGLRQTQSLVGWEAGLEHEGFRQFLKDLARLLGETARIEPIVAKHWWLSPRQLLILPTVVAMVVTMGLMQLPLSTTIKLDVTTERVEFVVGTIPNVLQPIMDVGHVRSISIEKFAALSFAAASIQVADPTKYDLVKAAIPEFAWIPLTPSEPNITFVGGDTRLHPRITIDPLSEGGQVGELELATDAVTGTTVILEARGRPTTQGHSGKSYHGLTIIGTEQGHTTLVIRTPFLLTADHMPITSVATGLAQEQQEVTYRIHLRPSKPWIKFDGRADGLILSLTFTPDQPTLIAPKGIPVEALEFTSLDQYGDRVSALTGDGTITFPDYVHLGRIKLAKGQAIGVTGLSGFLIKELTLNPTQGGLRLVGEGMAKEVLTKTGQMLIPHRLTAFDAIRYNPTLAAMLSIVLWVFPTTVGAYRLWKEFRR